MKKEYIAPVVITVLVIGGLIFSWTWYQNSKTATPPPPPAPAKTS